MGKWLAMGAFAALSVAGTGSLHAETIEYTDEHTIFADYDASASASAGAGWFVYDLVTTGELRDPAGSGNFSYVTIYDFAGLIAGSIDFDLGAAASGQGFTAAVATPNTGLTNGVIPNDSPDLPNITVRFENLNSGAVFSAATAGATLNDDGYAYIGTLKVRSSFTDTTIGDVSSYDYRTATRVSRSLTDTTVPQAAQVVPLPAAVWGGMGLFGVLAGVKLRGRRRPTELD